MKNKLMAAAGIASLALAPARAQSVADLLQKGIYAQQAAGDLDGAIQLFRQAIDLAAPSRALAAQALYHLGTAQAAKGDMGAAAQTFRQLLDRYPEQRDLAARLQQYLPAFKPGSAQTGFTATIYRDPGTSGVSFALPPGWTAAQSEVDSTQKPVTIHVNGPPGELGINVWVRTEKVDASTLAQKIQDTPDQKEAQMRIGGTVDFTIRRESVRPLQVGANKGLSAVAGYTSRGEQVVIVDDRGEPAQIAMQGILKLSSAGEVISGPQDEKRVELFSWLWGTGSRVVIFARDVDPGKLAELQPIFDSIVNTVVIP